MSDRICPDGGVCHHECVGLDCFRTRCCEPLSGVYPGDRWPDWIAGAPMLFVGGPFDGRVEKVWNFREDVTPDEYEGATSYVRAYEDGLFHEDGGYISVFQRFDVVLWKGLAIRSDGMTVADTRKQHVMAALAKALGILYTRPKGD